jgi:hypothetical protein
MLTSYSRIDYSPQGNDLDLNRCCYLNGPLPSRQGIAESVITHLHTALIAKIRVVAKRDASQDLKYADPHSSGMSLTGVTTQVSY